MSTYRETLDELTTALNRAAAALQAAGIPFVLGGGLAAWARGGPPIEGNVDLFVRDVDARRALDALEESGVRTGRPRRGRFSESHDDDIIVNVTGGVVSGTRGERFLRATWLGVAGTSILVASIEDVLVTELLALSEQNSDFRRVLALARSLRGRIDWGFVRGASTASPFARAYLMLVDELGIVE
jgi:hypothetical protein